MNSKKIATTALLSLFMLTGCGGTHTGDVEHLSIADGKEGICDRLVKDATKVAVGTTADGKEIDCQVGYFNKSSYPGNTAEDAKLVDYTPDFDSLLAGDNGYYDVFYRALDGLKITAKHKKYNTADDTYSDDASKTNTRFYDVSFINTDNDPIIKPSENYDFAVKATVSKYVDGTLDSADKVTVDVTYSTEDKGSTFAYRLDDAGTISKEYISAENSFIGSIYKDVTNFTPDTVKGYTRTKPDTKTGVNTSDYFFGHTFFESGTQLRETEMSRYGYSVSTALNKMISNAKKQLFVNRTSFYAVDDRVTVIADSAFRSAQKAGKCSSLFSLVAGDIKTQLMDSDLLAFTVDYGIKGYFDLDGSSCKDKTSKDFSLSRFISYYGNKITA